MGGRQLGENDAEASSTQSPSSSSNSNNRSSSTRGGRSSTYSNAEPLLTPGEKAAAVFGLTVTVLIGLYFLLLSIRVRKYRKKRKEEQSSECELLEDIPPPLTDERRAARRSWLRQERRRKRRSSSKKDDDTDRSTSLTILGGDDLASQNEPQPNSNPNKDDSDCDSEMATVGAADAGVGAKKYIFSDDRSYPTNASKSHHDGDDEATEVDSCAYTLSSSDDDDDGGGGATQYTSGSASAYTTVFSHSLTSVVLYKLFPHRSNNRSKDEDDADEGEGEDEGETHSAYHRHEDEKGDTESTSTVISSPFHPSPPQHRLLQQQTLRPDRLQRSSPMSPTSKQQENKSSQKPCFLRNDDSGTGETVKNADNDSDSSGDSTNIFTGLPKESTSAIAARHHHNTKRSRSLKRFRSSEHPFDCTTEDDMDEDRPFDC